MLEKAIYSDVTLDYSEPKIIVANYEALQTIEIAELLNLWNPEILVCDESQRLKNFKSKRANKVFALAEKAKHRYILTGTPILNSSEDIYMQFKILDLGFSFGTNFYAFRAMYFEDANAAWSSKPGHFPKYRPKPHTYEEFHKRIYNKAFRVTKAECLDLPPLIKTTRAVELSKEQTRMYKEMSEEYVTWVASKRASGETPLVIANLAITKALRLQQIVSGFVKDDDGVVHSLEDVPRAEELKNLLEELTPDNKVIVWACFKENYTRIAGICEKLGIGYVELHGEISAKDKELAMGRFRNDNTVQVIIANQQSAGLGINLVEASYSIYYSKNFSLEQDLQSEARNHRGGSEIHERVTRIDLVAEGTIDELVNEALKHKQKISDVILDWKL